MLWSALVCVFLSALWHTHAKQHPFETPLLEAPLLGRFLHITDMHLDKHYKEHAAVVGDDIYGKKDTVVGTDNFGSENGEENSKDAESLHSPESYGAEETVVIRLDTIKHECFLLVG